MNILVIENDFYLDPFSEVWEILEDRFKLKGIFTKYEQRKLEDLYVGFKNGGNNGMILIGCMYHTSSMLIPDLLAKHEVLVFESTVLDKEKYILIIDLILSGKTTIKQVFCCHSFKNFNEYIKDSYLEDKKKMNEALKMVEFFSINEDRKYHKVLHV